MWNLFGRDFMSEYASSYERMKRADSQYPTWSSTTVTDTLVNFAGVWVNTGEIASFYPNPNNAAHTVVVLKVSGAQVLVPMTVEAFVDQYASLSNVTTVKETVAAKDRETVATDGSK